MTNTNPNPETERVALVSSPMLVKSTGTQQPEARKRATRSTDSAIAEWCNDFVAASAVVADDKSVKFLPWVDALRTMRWSAGFGCDYKRFRPLYSAACERFAAETRKRTRKSA
jgi:hypothetical protein